MQVSIVIPVYNAAEYLREAVASALAQPEVAEVILVDDASKDGSLALAKQLQQEDARVVVLTHPNGSNQGSAETRNVGIRAARYDYVAFIDADDWFLPNRFAVTKQLFAQHPDADGVYEAVENVLTDKAQSYAKSVSLDNTPAIHMVHRAVAPENLLALLVDDPTGIILLQGLCVKRSLFARTGLFDVAFRVSEDMLLIKKMAAVGNLYHGSITQPVSARRIHNSNISFSAFKDKDDKKFLEAEVLLKWATGRFVPADKMNAIIRFNYRLFFYRHQKPIADSGVRIKWLATVLLAHPKTLFYKQYWAAMPLIGKLVK